MAFANKILNLILLLSVGTSMAQELNHSGVVLVEQGQVQGSIKYTRERKQFYAFQGIPYGKAPTGPLRFKAPEPALPWSGVFQATSDAPLCIQPITKVLTINDSVIGSEDCLKLSVYTPKLPHGVTKTSLNVLVHIHGGGFAVRGIEYDFLNPERFMNADIVVVVMQYRLGALGFLATDDEAASGNWGLLDQNLALKWIQKNIANFGGNPNDVTLAGHSAGSMSVIIHCVSPMSAGLFHRAIAQSGTPLSRRFIQKDPSKNAYEMFERFNCNTINATTADLIDCLRQVDAKDIVKYTLTIPSMRYIPSIETSSSGKILQNYPFKLLQKGNFTKVPLLIGFARHDADMFFQNHYLNFQNISNSTVVDTIQDVMKYTISNEVVRNAAAEATASEYFNGVNFENQTEVNIAALNFLSDSMFKSGACKTAALVSSYNVTTYLYAYNYVSSYSKSNFTGEPDVGHGSELRYLWYTNITNAKDVEFGKRFFKLWTNFILNGNPTETVEPADDLWMPTPPGQYYYYDIKQHFTMKANYDSDHMKFWWQDFKVIAIKNMLLRLFT